MQKRNPSTIASEIGTQRNESSQVTHYRIPSTIATESLTGTYRPSSEERNHAATMAATIARPGATWASADDVVAGPSSAGTAVVVGGAGGRVGVLTSATMSPTTRSSTEPPLATTTS